MDISPGTRLGHYQIRSKLGAGGKLPPALGGAPPKLQSQESFRQLNIDDGDIPRAVPKEKKPQKP